MELKCPKCKHTFEVDDMELAEITSQIRESILDSEIDARVSEYKKTAEALHAQELKAAISEAKADSQAKYASEISELRQEVTSAKLKLSNAKTELELAVVQATSKLESAHKHEIMVLQKEHDAELKRTNDELSYYKDLKSRMSTKMVGETLEQHCLIEFNKIRGMLSKNVYFDKDNEVSATGSKGDFIYREVDDDGVELISIMFEMKNEMDDTERKHKNEDFFKELDKDRREKKCEYAILVTLLESDNELYNSGIVDVSYQYNKMYVIRPQFFIPMITILRNAALSSLSAKRELERVKNQNIDITHFEDDLLKFKEGFMYNYTQAHKRFDEAIAEIDKSISYMQKVKDSLLASDRQLRLASDKADDLTVKRLCRNNPTMTEKFNALGGNENGISI